MGCWIASATPITELARQWHFKIGLLNDIKREYAKLRANFGVNISSMIMRVPVFGDTALLNILCFFFAKRFLSFRVAFIDLSLFNFK